MLAVWVWTLAALYPLHGFAQPTETDLAYESAVSEALGEMRAGRLLEARALFLQAHAIKPSARTLRGLGVVALELRQYAEADYYLRQSLDDPRRPLTERQRGEAHKALRRLHGLLGHFALAVAPANAEVLIDGLPARLHRGQLSLEVGAHTLTASAPSHEPYRRDLTVRGGEQELLQIALTPLPPPPVARVAEVAEPPPVAPAPRAVAKRDGKRRDRRSGAVTIALGSGVAVAGAVLLGIGLRDVAKVEGADDGTRWSSIEPSRDRAPVLTSVGAAGIGVGVGVAALGLWILQRKERSGRTPVDMAIGPLGVSVRGRL